MPCTQKWDREDGGAVLGRILGRFMLGSYHDASTLSFGVSYTPYWKCLEVWCGHRCMDVWKLRRHVHHEDICGENA